MKRFLVLFMTSQLLLLSSRSCFTDEFKFDPATCRENTGPLYVALGKYVLATPSSTGNLVIDPITNRLKAPDPSQPLGCFGNPLQSNSHSLFHPMVFANSASGQNNPLFPDLLTLYNLRRGNSASDQKDEEWMAEVSAGHIADRVCRTATLREDLANGLLACRIEPGDSPNARQEDWVASYISRSGSYGTPLGKPFIINCGPGLLSDGIDHCGVAYEVKPGIGVSYRFQPYRSSHPIPIDQIIAYDKSLREAIDRSLVKDYAWPEDR